MKRIITRAKTGIQGLVSQVRISQWERYKQGDTGSNVGSLKIIWLLCRKCITQGQEKGKMPEGCGRASGDRLWQSDQGK